MLFGATTKNTQVRVFKGEGGGGGLVCTHELHELLFLIHAHVCEGARMIIYIILRMYLCINVCMTFPLFCGACIPVLSRAHMHTCMGQICSPNYCIQHM
jgi:hypothetical protein